MQVIKDTPIIYDNLTRFASQSFSNLGPFMINISYITSERSYFNFVECISRRNSKQLIHIFNYKLFFSLISNTRSIKTFEEMQLRPVPWILFKKNILSSTVLNWKLCCLSSVKSISRCFKSFSSRYWATYSSYFGKRYCTSSTFSFKII